MVPHPNIKLVCLLEVRHHLLGFWWSPDFKRNLPFPPRLAYPPCQPQVRDAYYVIRVEVSEKQTADVCGRDSELKKPLHRTTAGIEENFFSSSFHKGAWPEAVDKRRGTTCSQQGNPKSFSFDDFRHFPR